MPDATGITDDERAIVHRLAAKARKESKELARLSAYRDGSQRLELIGMAVPPELRRFLVLLGWPRVVVDTIRDRQQERAYLMDGAEEADETARGEEPRRQ